MREDPESPPVTLGKLATLALTAYLAFSTVTTILHLL
jgi:hypothetical protein